MNEKLELEFDEEAEPTAEKEVEAELNEASEENDGDLLYEGKRSEKNTELYDAAVRSVVFGSLSIILPLLAWVASCVGSLFVPILIAAAGLVFAIIGLKGAKKCRKEALCGTLSEGMAKTGRLVSIIGTIVSAVALAYLAAVAIITVVVVLLVVVFYVFVYVVAFLSYIMMGV